MRTTLCQIPHRQHQKQRRKTHKLSEDKSDIPTFKRVIIPAPTVPSSIAPAPPSNGVSSTNGTSTAVTSTETAKPAQEQPPGVNCRACAQHHPVGSCPLKIAGVEFCNLCGMAHYGHARVCPHIQSETQVSTFHETRDSLLTSRQVRAMLEALKYSNEPEHLVNEARRYLRGLKGNLVQLKKRKEEQQHAQREAAYAAQQQQQHTYNPAGYSVPAWPGADY